MNNAWPNRTPFKRHERRSRIDGAFAREARAQLSAGPRRQLRRGQALHRPGAIVADPAHPRCSPARRKPFVLRARRWQLWIVLATLPADRRGGWVWALRPRRRCVVAPVVRRGRAACARAAVAEHASLALARHRRDGVPHHGHRSAPLGLARSRVIPIELKKDETPEASVVDELDTAAPRVGREAGVRAAVCAATS